MSRPRSSPRTKGHAVWGIVKNGRCTVHDVAVGRLTRLCVECHYDDLERAGVRVAARQGQPS